MEDRAPVRRRRRARLLAIPAVAALGLGVGAATAAADPPPPPPAVTLDILGLVKIELPVVIGGANGNTLATSVNVIAPDLASAAVPITADFGTGSLVKLNLGLKLDIPLLFALNLPLPPVLVNAQHLLGGLPVSLGIDAKGLDINLVAKLL